MKNIWKSISLKFKILIICWSFLVPVLYLLYVTADAYNKDISFAEQERLGISWLRPSVSILNRLVRFESLHFDASKGNAEAIQKMSDVAKEIDVDIDHLKSLKSTVGEKLKFTSVELDARKRSRSSVDAISKYWGELKANALSAKKLNGDDIVAMISDIRGMIAHVGDTSNIILDPDLDTYYLGDVIIGALPQAFDRARQIEDHLNAVSVAGKTDLTAAGPVLAAMTREADLGRIISDITTARAEDGNFYGTNDVLQSKIQAIADGMKKLGDTLASHLDRPRDPKNHAATIGELIQLVSAYQTIFDTTATAMDTMLESRINAYSHKKTTAISVSLALVLIMVLCSYLIISGIAKSIETIAAAVAGEAKNLAGVSDLLDTAIQGATMATTQQSAAIEETVSSMEEMGSMIALTTQNAATTKSDTAEGRQETDRGKGVVNEMVSSMGEIASASDRLQGIIRVINEITDKTKVINEIAFETRLLAFNASIEAARAGAHGRGFAVVAEEVGKLANVSSKAADEVRTLLESSIGQVNSVITDTKSRVDHGQKTTAACAAAFGKVEDSIRRVSEGIERIASAAKEQDIGVKQTNQAMQEMEKVSQASVRTGENLATQSHQLRSTATSLQSSADGMYRIILGGGGKSTSSSRRTPPPEAQPPMQIKPPTEKKPGTALKKVEKNGHTPTLVEPAEAQLGRNDSRWNAA